MKLNRLVKLAIALEDSEPETLLQLMSKCETTSSRREIFKALAIIDVDLKKLVKTVNLIQIEGIGEKEVEMLEAVGVVTVKDIATINAETLHHKLESYGEEKSISIPNEEGVLKWIEQAKTLYP